MERLRHWPDELGGIVHGRKRLVECLMQLPRLFRKGKPESSRRARLREEPKHLRPLCLLAALIQAEVLVIEPGCEALDFPEQFAIHLPFLTKMLESGDNLFPFEPYPRDNKRAGHPRGLALVRGGRAPEALGQVWRN